MRALSCFLSLTHTLPLTETLRAPVRVRVNVHVRCSSKRAWDAQPSLACAACACSRALSLRLPPTPSLPPSPLVHAPLYLASLCKAGVVDPIVSSLNEAARLPVNQMTTNSTRQVNKSVMDQRNDMKRVGLALEVRARAHTHTHVLSR